ncbi:MAG: substrate-binding domain-containing protein [Actinobacteria bacterium]|nr:substrate-binding domain-containing protein [Actinomycetota bacterium]
MKKKLLFSLILILCVSMITAFLLIGCKKAATVETTASETTAAATTAAETTAPPTTAAEATTATEVAKEDEIDPWIASLREIEAPYAGDKVRFVTAEGITPQYDIDLVLTNGEVEKIRQGKYTLAFCDDRAGGDYSRAFDTGMLDALNLLGIQLIALTDGRFDPAIQKNNVETVLTLKPSIIFGSFSDPETGREIYKPAYDAGVILVFGASTPAGWTAGKEYVANNTNNAYDNAYNVAKKMVDSVPEGSEVLMTSYKENYFVLNVMSQAVRDAVKENGPSLTLYEAEYIDFNAIGEAVAGALTLHPNIKAIYADWYGPAMQSVAELEAINRKDIGIYTFGLDEPSLLEFLKPDGMIKAITSDFTYHIGVNQVILAAYGLLGKKAPSMVVSPSVVITPDNLREVWNIVYKNVPLSKAIDEALKALGK